MLCWRCVGVYIYYEVEQESLVSLQYWGHGFSINKTTCIISTDVELVYLKK